MGTYDFDDSIGSDYTWKSFGDELIATADLDPVYVMLAEADHLLSESMLKRFLLAYWCFYHCGVAAHIAESKDFYKTMWRAIRETWPRGTERRYFYGLRAKGTIAYLVGAGAPERIVDDMCNHDDFQSSQKVIMAYEGFGPLVGWKVADMAERVLGYDVDFSNSTLDAYVDPRQGAALIKFGDWRHPISDDELEDVCYDMESYFMAKHNAPPLYDRRVNIQEIKTILCKHKDLHKGAYFMGKDTREVRFYMEGWGDLSEELRKFLPPDIHPKRKQHLDIHDG